MRPAASTPQTPPEVHVLASHPASGFSMQRYSQMLQRGYSDAGVATRLTRPGAWLSSRARNSALRKFWVYVEALIIFPLSLLSTSRRATFHIADHSDAMWVLPLRILGRRRIIVTCHDLIAVRAALREIPEHVPRWSGRLYQAAVRFSLSRADLVSCVSSATRSDVERIVARPATALLLNPIDPSLTIPSDREWTSHSYFLVVSSSGWRKQRERAVEFWQRYRAVTGRDVALHIVGTPLTESERRSHSSGAILNHESLTDMDLAALYRDALAVLQLSKYEGFGWPIVEANQQGTVAVCSDISVFREVGAGNLFVPDDLSQTPWDEILDGIDRARSRVSFSPGIERFEWERFVRTLSTIVVA